MSVATDQFDGGCAPPNPAPLAAAGVRGELKKWRFAPETATTRYLNASQALFFLLTDSAS